MITCVKIKGVPTNEKKTKVHNEKHINIHFWNIVFRSNVRNRIFFSLLILTS